MISIGVWASLFDVDVMLELAIQQPQQHFVCWKLKPFKCDQTCLEAVLFLISVNCETRTCLSSGTSGSKPKQSLAYLHMFFYASESLYQGRVPQIHDIHDIHYIHDIHDIHAKFTRLCVWQVLGPKAMWMPTGWSSTSSLSTPFPDTLTSMPIYSWMLCMKLIKLIQTPPQVFSLLSC